MTATPPQVLPQQVPPPQVPPQRALPPQPDHAGAGLAEEVSRLRQAIDRLSSTDYVALPAGTAAALAVELRSLAGRLSLASDQALLAVEADGSWALDGSRTVATWAARRTGESVGSVQRDLRVARALRDDLPRTREAALAGDVTVDHARALATVAATSDARREALREPEGCNEEFLLEQANELDADHFRTVVRHWAAVADPEADDRGYRKAAEKEFFELARTLDGYHVAGFLTEEHGQVVSTALRSVMGTPSADDPRSAPQRRAAALHDLARLALDHGMTGTGAAVRPHLSVLVPLERLEGPARLERAAHLDGRAHLERPVRVDRLQRHDAEPHDAEPYDAEPHTESREQLLAASYEDGTPIPRLVLDRLACDSEVSRIVFGPPGVVLDVGRSQRTVTGQLRRAVIARDRACRYPGCGAPPQRTEVHHPHHWADGGVTSVANSVLLCWHHHEWVHRMSVTIRMVDGTWTFSDRHGRPVGRSLPSAA